MNSLQIFLITFCFNLLTFFMLSNSIKIKSFLLHFHTNISKKQSKNKAPKKRKNKIKKPNFSKSIVVIYFITALPLIIYTLMWSWKFADSTPLCVVLTLVTGVGVAIVNGYFKKAQAENLLQIRKEMLKMNIETTEIDMKIEENINEDITINI